MPTTWGISSTRISHRGADRRVLRGESGARATTIGPHRRRAGSRADRCERVDSACPSITINGRACSFNPGEVITQVSNREGLAIPQYCYHEGLSIVASCRICLAEIWMPDKATGKLMHAPGAGS